VSFLDRLSVHTLDGYDVRAQVLALVRDHLKPVNTIRSAMKSATARSAAWRANANSIYFIEWPKPTRWVATLIGFRARSGMTPLPRIGFIDRARELDVESKAPAPILLGRHLLKWV